MKKYAIIIVSVILVAVISVAAIVSINASNESSNTRGNNKPDSADMEDATSTPSRIGEEKLQYPASNDEYEYKVYETYVEIVWYSGLNTDIIIPNEIDGLPVKVIGPYAFHKCKPQLYSNGNYGTTKYESPRLDITSVVLPEELVIISDCAFWNEALREIVIPDSVLTIGESAFNYNFLLSSVTFGKHLTQIGKSAFHDCNLRGEIVLPNGLISIGENAFDITSDSGSHNNIKYYSTDSSVGQAKLRGESTYLANPGFYAYEIDLNSIMLYEPGDATFIIPPSVSEIGTNAFNDYRYSLIAQKGSSAVQYIADSQYKKYTICDSVDQYYK